LYVGNLPFDCTAAELEQLFSDRGFTMVRRTHLPLDPEGRARGFGFVALDSADAARRAVDELHDASVRGRRLSISVARARGAPGTGGSGNYPRAGGAAPPGPRPVRPMGGSGSYAAAPRYDAPSSFDGPPAPFSGGGGGGGSDDEARRPSKWAGAPDKEKEKKKEKKRKVKAAPAPVKRRRDDDFRSTRAQDYVDDWDDD
jgi:RNA recognition motif-containing protein